MFYLRIIFCNGNQENICLGNRYRKITPEFKCSECWVDHYRSMYPSCGMLIYPESGDAIPIYESNKNFIVTENGNTYEKLKPNDLPDEIRYSKEDHKYMRYVLPKEYYDPKILAPLDYSKLEKIDIDE